MWGIDGDTVEGALASDKIIVSVEKIISNSKIKEAPEKTVIPSYRVSNVIVDFHGAHTHHTFRVFIQGMMIIISNMIQHQEMRINCRATLKIGFTMLEIYKIIRS